jgi:hypothetical protein
VPKGIFSELHLQTGRLRMSALVSAASLSRGGFSRNDRVCASVDPASLHVM